MSIIWRAIESISKQQSLYTRADENNKNAIVYKESAKSKAAGKLVEVVLEIVQDGADVGTDGSWCFFC